jgi:hypothetical protein
MFVASLQELAELAPLIKSSTEMLVAPGGQPCSLLSTVLKILTARRAGEESELILSFNPDMRESLDFWIKLASKSALRCMFTTRSKYLGNGPHLAVSTASYACSTAI